MDEYVMGGPIVARRDIVVDIRTTLTLLTHSFFRAAQDSRIGFDNANTRSLLLTDQQLIVSVSSCDERQR